MHCQKYFNLNMKLCEILSMDSTWCTFALEMDKYTYVRGAACCKENVMSEFSEFAWVSNGFQVSE